MHWSRGDGKAPPDAQAPPGTAMGSPKGFRHRVPAGTMTDELELACDGPYIV